MKTRRALGLCLLAVSVAACGGRKSVVPAIFSPQGEMVASETHAASHFASESQWGPPGDNNWEPVTAADPTSQWVYQMTTAQTPNLLLFRSSADGGKTWHAARNLCRRGIKLYFQYDPQVVVGGDGAVDAVCLDNYRPGVVFTRSSDHGASFSAPVHVDGTLKYSDHPVLLVSPSGRDIYVAYNDYNAMYVSASHDSGATWSAPVKATTHAYWYYPTGGAIAPNGSVWFAVDGETGKNQTGDGHLGLVSSSDGGSTWSTKEFALTHEGAPCTFKNCYPDFYTGQAAVAIDRAGNMVFVYGQNAVPQGPNTLYATHSRDGATWSAPVAINPAGNADSPAIAAAPGSGDFRLVWQDDRNGANAWNTWYARSTDCGATWGQQIRLSDRGAGAPYKHAAGYQFPFGDYLGFSVDSRGINHVIWGEGAAVYVPGGTWWTLGGP